MAKPKTILIGFEGVPTTAKALKLQVAAAAASGGTVYPKLTMPSPKDMMAAALAGTTSLAAPPPKEGGST